MSLYYTQYNLSNLLNVSIIKQAIKHFLLKMIISVKYLKFLLFSFQSKNHHFKIEFSKLTFIIFYHQNKFKENI